MSAAALGELIQPALYVFPKVDKREHGHHYHEESGDGKDNQQRDQILLLAWSSRH
ncbi:hypothetical protein GCM10011383_38290 [Hymenobacter cavernae]|uniref:Uncharacterized protein n=1 Tax=Hymenobacter cavernae TaxID=2044852 RepID=A0ABQ1UNF1_9BACT|nr:hypothetical protein GCM10011383_38290 [Hymenobacter cavernae]